MRQACWHGERTRRNSDESGSAVPAACAAAGIQGRRGRLPSSTGSRRRSPVTRSARRWPPRRSTTSSSGSASAATTSGRSTCTSTGSSASSPSSRSAAAAAVASAGPSTPRSGERLGAWRRGADGAACRPSGWPRRRCRPPLTPMPAGADVRPADGWPAMPPIAWAAAMSRPADARPPMSARRRCARVAPPPAGPCRPRRCARCRPPPGGPDRAPMTTEPPTYGGAFDDDRRLRGAAPAARRHDRRAPHGPRAARPTHLRRRRRRP